MSATYAYINSDMNAKVARLHILTSETIKHPSGNS